MNGSTDVVVVGAGIVGAATAFHLAAQGAKVTVVDKGGVCAGATGISSGFVRVHLADPDLMRLARAGWHEFTSWADVVGRPATFQRTGCVHCVPPGEEDRLPADAAFLRSEGVECEVVGAAELRALHPDITWPDDVVALWEPGAGWASPLRSATQYLERVVEMGGRIVAGAATTGVATSGGRVTAVETDQGSFPAGAAVVAIGAWAATSKVVGEQLPIRSRHIVEQRLLVSPEPADLPLYVDDGPETLLFRPDGPGAVLVGTECGAWDMDPDAAFVTSDPPLLEAGHRRFRARLGGPFVSSHEKVKAGADGFTPDGLPLVDRWPGTDGLFVAVGMNGGGFKGAPAVGRAVATWVTTGARDDLLAPFGVGRFLAAEQR